MIVDRCVPESQVVHRLNVIVVVCVAARPPVGVKATLTAAARCLAWRRRFLPTAFSAMWRRVVPALVMVRRMLFTYLPEALSLPAPGSLADSVVLLRVSVK